LTSRVLDLGRFESMVSPFAMFVGAPSRRTI
jgi:hypothetical protein